MINHLTVLDVIGDAALLGLPQRQPGPPAASHDNLFHPAKITPLSDDWSGHGPGDTTQLYDVVAEYVDAQWNRTTRRHLDRG